MKSILNVWKLANWNKGLNFLATFFVLISVALGVATFNILGLFINETTKINTNAFNFDNFIILLVLLILLEVFYILSKYFSKILINKNVLFVKKILRNNFFDKLTTKSYKEFNSKEKGYYHSFFVKNIEYLQDNGFFLLFNLIQSVFWILGVSISLGIIFWPLVIAFFLVVLLVILFNLMFTKYFERLGAKFQNIFSSYVAKLQSTLLGYSDFYSVNKRKYFLQWANKAPEDLYHEYNSTLLKYINPLYLTYGINVIGRLVIIGISSFFVINGKIEIGLFLSIFTLSEEGVGMTLPATLSISKIIGTKEFINSYLDLETKIQKSKKQKMQIKNISKISLENISFNYFDKEKKVENQILNNFNFIIEKNKKYAIVGKSGIGKSTLLKLLMGIEKPTKGKIIINEHDLEKIDLDFFYKKISFIDKNAAFLDETIKNNIILDSGISNEKLEKILSLSQINFKSRLEEKLDENIKLSEGQKQKILLARSLALNRKILFIDEAFSSIDAKSLENIRKKLLKIENLTVVEITHNLEKSMEILYDKIIKL